MSSSTITATIIFSTLLIIIILGTLSIDVSASIEYPILDGSCKHMSELRYNQNPPIENQVLRQVLKEYEIMHRDSTTKSNPEKVFQSTGDSKYKYVYAYMGSSGLGNRLLNLVSSFLLALITNRVLIIFSPDYDLREVLCTPFPGSMWVLSHDVQIPGGKVVNKHGFSLETTDFSSLNTQILKMDNVEQYVLTQLFVNQHHIDRLHQLFPGRNVGTVLLKYLIHPSNSVWEGIMNSFDQRAKDALTVGLQLRHPVQSPMAALTCLPSLPENNTHVFIASLGSVEAELKKKRPLWGVTQTYTEGGERHDLAQVKTALHDMVLLSMCDKVVISVRSTFGYVVMALKGSLCPIAGNNLHDAGTDTDACSWPNSHEICNHVGYVAMKQMNDSGRIHYHEDAYPAIYTGPCVDYKSGIRLNTGRERLKA